MRGVTRMEEGAGRTLTVTGFAPVDLPPHYRTMGIS
jgi:hypothetical protein